MSPRGVEPVADRWIPVLEEDRARPDRPPADLLRAAAATLARRHGAAEAAVTWSLGPARHRPHSHLLQLRADLGGGTHADAWYKVTFVPPAAEGGGPDPGWVRDARAASCAAPGPRGSWNAGAAEGTNPASPWPRPWPPNRRRCGWS